MADDAGRQLGHLLRNRLVALLEEARKAIEDAGALPALTLAGAPWIGTGLEGHLLAAPALPADGNPVTAQVLAALGKLATGSGLEHVAGVFGWEPAAGGAPRGIACAVRLGPAGGPGLAGALVVAATGLEVLASGASGEEAAVLVLDERWALRAGGRVAGRLRVGLSADGPPTVEGATAGDVLRLALTRSPPARLGEGPGIDLGALAFTAEVSFGSDGAPSLEGRLEIRGGAVRLPLQEFAALIPGLGPVPLDLDVGFGSATGVDIAGSPTLTVRLASGGSLPGLSMGPLDVSVGLNGTALDVRVAGSVGLDLAGFPVHLDLAGLGLAMPFSLGGDAPAGFDPSRLAPAVPSGAGIDLGLPMISGSGRVQRTDDGRYAGLISVSLPPLSVNAFGVLGLDPFSLLVVLGATFPPPGIQIGFGFSVNGIGGIVGINTRVDREALTRAVFDGTAAAMLFPADPQAQSREVIATLPAIFPAAPGRVIVGPMFQLAWGGGLLTATVALLLELPDPRVTLLGKIALSVPNPALPLILIQVTFVGQVDPSEPSISFVASLEGSSIVGIPLTGDLFFLTRGGDDADMVLSVGGFHPQFRRPRGVPDMQRLGMDLSASPLLDLRCSAYFAVTTNSVQFGARVDLVGEIAGCGLRGHLGFDVLIELQPLHFIAEVSVSISVRVLGETLAAIGLDLSLEGPARWRARGRGTVELFLFNASFDFDFEWGDPPAVSRVVPDIAKLLGDALRSPDAWVARPPDPRSSPIVLTAAATRALADGRVVHPHGTLTARQKVVPLGVAISRFNHFPIDAQRWDVARPVLGAGRPATAGGEVREPFAPGEFLGLDDAQQLGRPAFEAFRVGVDLVSGEVLVAPAKTADLSYETKVIAEAVPAVKVEIDLGELFAGIEEIVAAGAGHPAWLAPPQPPIVVEPDVRRVVVSGWSAVAAPDVVAAPDATATELHEAVNLVAQADPLRRVAVVEAWELVA